MKSKKTQIIFFGTEDFSLPSLEMLVEAEYEVQAVVTKPDTRRGRGKRLVSPAVKSYARKHGIPVLQPESSQDILPSIQDYSADIGALVAYGKILPEEVLEYFEKGIVNAHPSLLPRYRGPAPIEAAILNGDEMTGVTLMKLTKEMDAGPIYLQEEVALNGSETKPELYSKLATTSAALLTKNLEHISNDKIPLQTQNESEATYTKMIEKGDGDLDWGDSASHNERKVRAYLGWPGSRAVIDDYELIVLNASVVNIDSEVGLLQKVDNFPVVGCKKDSMRLDLVKPPGKKAMDGDAFVRGYLKD